MHLLQWSKVLYNNILHLYGTFHPKALLKLCTENITKLQQFLSNKGHKAMSIQNVAWDQYEEVNLSNTFPIIKFFLHFQYLHRKQITLFSIFYGVHESEKRKRDKLRGNNTISGPILLSFETGICSRYKLPVQRNKIFPSPEMQTWCGKAAFGHYNTSQIWIQTTAI